MAIQTGDYTARPPAFNRTPLQVFLLDVATFSLYDLYYLIYNYRLAQLKLGQRPRPSWAWLFIFIPPFNLYLYFGGYSTIGRRVKASGIHPWSPFGLQALIMTLPTIARLRLPGAWGLLALILSALMLASMSASVAKAEAADFPELPKPKLTPWEIGILIIGLGIFALALFGALVDALP